MKYYLGRKIKEDSYEKIDLSKVIQHPEEIESIFNYVFKFANYQELVDDLYDKGAIDTKLVQLAYCSLLKGKLKPIYNGTCMYFKEAKPFFNYNNMRLYLYENQYNLGLVEFLLTFAMRKYRVAAALNKSFMKYAETINGFQEHIKFLLSKDFSEETKTRLQYLLDYLDRENVISIKGDDRYLRIIENTLNDLVENDHDLLTYYHCEPSHGRLPDSVETLIRLYRMVREENLVGQYNFEMTPDEDNDVKSVLEQLLREETTNKQKDETRTRSYRKQIDFAMLLYNYSRGIYRPYEEIPDIKPEEDLDGQETIYEEDDWKRQFTKEELKEIDLAEVIENQGFEPMDPNNPNSFYHRK